MLNKQRVILVLDNDPPRHAIFRAAAPECHVVQTYEVFPFAQALQEGDGPDLICLDHDLQSGANADRRCNDCGCDAAELIALRGPADVPVLIHSSNASCALVMRRILVASGRMGRVSRINTATVMAHGDRAGIETLRQEIVQLLVSPRWPEDIPTDELLEILGDDPEVICPVRASRRPL